jgi:hypothetical protein
MQDANPKPMALKPFLESLNEQCDRLSKKKLTEVLLGLAREIPLKDRAGFLQTIERLSQAPTPASWDEGILSQIQELKRDIRARIASIEDGTFFDEERRDYDGWDYLDEVPDELSEEQRNRFEAYLRDAAELFLGGRLERAREVYASLFELLDRFCDLPEEDSRYLSSYDFGPEVREAHARYARCVYETTPRVQRVSALKSVMRLEARLSPAWLDVYENPYPMLEDVMQALPQELPEREEFLREWLEALRSESSDRAQMLLLEAAALVEGPDGVRSRVQAWGGQKPLGWLFWMRLLALRNDWHGVATAAAEALPLVAQPQPRARIAERLTEAGTKLRRADLVLTGKREIFFSRPSDKRLLRLLDEAEMRGVHDQELERALEFVTACEHDHETLRMKLLLMTGRLEAAFEKAGDLPAIGWSYVQSAGAVLFGAVLSMLCQERPTAAAMVRRVLVRHADEERWSDAGEAGFDGETRTAPALSVSGEILRGLGLVRVSSEQKARYLEWATRVGRKRIEQIVSNQHRGAYGRAAEVLGALAETFLLKGRNAEALELVSEYRERKYSRHRAFRRELDEVIHSSTLLRRAWEDRHDAA